MRHLTSAARPLAALLAVSMMVLGSRASAQVPSFDGNAAAEGPPPAAARVSLAVDIEGPVRAQSASGTEHCSGPCTLQVAPGFVEVKAGDQTKELYVEGPSRVVASRGVPALRQAGLVMLAAGIVVVLAATIIPLAVCGPDRRVDASGYVRDRNPCRDVSDGVKVGWVAGGGIGLTTTIAGAIVYGSAGPSLRLAPASPASARTMPEVGIAPWIDRPASPRPMVSERTGGLVGGAVLVGRF